MLKLLASRLLQMIFIMSVISLILFAIFDSDKFKKQIAVNELGGFAVSALSDQDYQAWLQKKGLQVPFYERYLNWASGVARGDFGKSFEKNESVAGLLATRLAKTGLLAFWVFALMIPLSLLFGVIAGMREGSFQDRLTSFISVLTTSLPEIATAIILTVIFALGLRWLPSNAAMVNGWDWRALVLPVLTLVLYDFGYVARMTRASMAEVMGSQYIRTAVLKGLPYRRVIMRHALRNALIPITTIIGLQFGTLLAGAIVTETIFSWPGIGRLTVQAISARDYPLLQGCILVIALSYVLVNLLTDFLYSLIDPRVRLS